jgi:hypothetical protein
MRSRLHSRSCHLRDRRRSRFSADSWEAGGASCSVGDSCACRHCSGGSRINGARESAECGKRVVVIRCLWQSLRSTDGH